MNTSTPQKPQTQNQPRTVILKPLESHLLEQFAADMQAAFQTAVERAPEAMPLPILPRQDIDQTLSHPGAEALTAWGNGQLIGGFYLRKCGFRIVDIFEEKHPEDAPPAEEENQPDLMFSFIKRLDGRWA